MTHLDLHVLQTVPPSNINRDDTGSPKSAVYGGVRRTRVSSQAWKRAMRMHFNDHLDKARLGQRTKRVVDMVAEAVRAQQPDVADDEAARLAELVLSAAGISLEAPKVAKGAEPVNKRSKYLMFLSAAQAANLAKLALEHVELSTPDAALKKAAKAAADQEHSIDISLFGRMVADQTDLSVDAAAQVAHAISIHRADTEFDYYTAVDDRATDEEAGAGMIGTIEFAASTLYRFASLNVDALRANLGDREVTQAAVEAFVLAFVKSLPTGKQTTFAHATLPEVVVAMIRDDRAVSLVGAFEQPIEPRDGQGRIALGAQALADTASGITQMYGSAPAGAWVAHNGSIAALDGIGTVCSVPQLAKDAAERATSEPS